MHPKYFELNLVEREIKLENKTKNKCIFQLNG